MGLFPAVRSGSSLGLLLLSPTSRKTDYQGRIWRRVVGPVVESLLLVSVERAELGDCWIPPFANRSRVANIFQEVRMLFYTLDIEGLVVTSDSNDELVVLEIEQLSRVDFVLCLCLQLHCIFAFISGYGLC